jgi:hypothetical protein
VADKKPAKAEDAKAAETPTTVTEQGTASADSNNEPGPSNGLDTKDQTAREFVDSGRSAHEFVKTEETPSGDVIRRRAAEADREGARDNLANLAAGNSNHNTTAGVNPVTVGYADRPDYNPQRRPSSRANQQSTTGESPTRMADRVDAKKEAKTNAEIVGERREQANEAREVPLRSDQSPYMGEI